CLMKVGKTGIEAGHSNSTSSVTILSLSACTLLLLDGVDKIMKVKDGSLWGERIGEGRINCIQLCR
ncbi:MAG: hypothetical protein DRJ64_04765, partial [Thermoprotei archaeon]